MANATAADFLEEDPAPPASAASAKAGRAQSGISRKAYASGKRGEDFEDFRQQHGLHDTHENLDVARQAHEQGTEDRQKADQDKAAKASKPLPSAGASKGSPASSSIELAHQGAGFLLGMLAYALTLNYLRYGWAGVTGWFDAKFRNKVTVGGSAGSNTGQAPLIPNANPGTGAPAPQTGGVWT